MLPVFQVLSLPGRFSRVVDGVPLLKTECRHTYRKFYVLTPGDSLIINNNRLVHGRSSFEPNFDGNDRFIIRSFILNTLDKIKNKTGSHNRMISIQHS